MWRQFTRSQERKAQIRLRAQQGTNEDLTQQVSEMQNTSHQFDLAFDAALERMEQRVARLETKSISMSAAAADAPTILRNGQG